MNQLIEVKYKATLENLPEVLAKSNKSKYNILKCCEELAELQEKLLKYVTKDKDHKPSMESICEEIGDVLVRTQVIIEQFDIFNEVAERIENKSVRLIELYNEGKYKGGL